jgi:hypothetical protein
MQAGVGISTCDEIEDGGMGYKKLTFLSMSRIRSWDLCILFVSGNTSIYRERFTSRYKPKRINVGNGCTDYSKDFFPSSIDMVWLNIILSDEKYWAYSEKC